MLKPKLDLTEEEIRAHIKRAGLGSLLRRLSYKRQSELARELGLTPNQVRGLFLSRLDLTRDLAEKLGRLLGQSPSAFIELSFLIV